MSGPTGPLTSATVTVSLRDNVYRALKDEILSCRLLPNSELREQVLARQFDVSKSPVREALLRLEQERLVTVAPRQGYRVTPVSLHDAREMFEMRLTLEPACVAGAARNASVANLDTLEEFRDYAGSPGLEPFISYNKAFHRALVSLSDNSRMSAVVSELIAEMERLIRLSVSVIPYQDNSVLIREHNEIIDAVQSRNARLAARLARQHAGAAEKRVLNALSQVAVLS